MRSRFTLYRGARRNPVHTYVASMGCLLASFFSPTIDLPLSSADASHFHAPPVLSRCQHSPPLRMLPCLRSHLPQVPLPRRFHNAACGRSESARRAVAAQTHQAPATRATAVQGECFGLVSACYVGCARRRSGYGCPGEKAEGHVPAHSSLQQAKVAADESEVDTPLRQDSRSDAALWSVAVAHAASLGDADVLLAR